jgi:hypothetical protein
MQAAQVVSELKEWALDEHGFARRSEATIVGVRSSFAFRCFASVQTDADFRRMRRR